MRVVPCRASQHNRVTVYELPHVIDVYLEVVFDPCLATLNVEVEASLIDCSVDCLWDDAELLGNYMLGLVLLE